MHRLWSVCACVPRVRYFCIGRPAGKMGGLHAQERRLLRSIGRAGSFRLPNPDLSDSNGYFCGQTLVDFIVKVFGDIFRRRIERIERCEFVQELMIQPVDHRNTKMAGAKRSRVMNISNIRETLVVINLWIFGI